MLTVKVFFTVVPSAYEHEASTFWLRPSLVRLSTIGAPVLFEPLPPRPAVAEKAATGAPSPSHRAVTVTGYAEPVAPLYGWPLAVAWKLIVGGRTIFTTTLSI